MSYDNWKTTDPAEMLHRVKSISLQLAADDAYVIAEVIEQLGSLLDRFQANHGEALAADLFKAWPDAEALWPGIAKRVYAFARSLEPVED